MPQQITKDMGPKDIEALVDEYTALLQKSNVPLKREETIRDMERRAADMNGMTVEQWRQHHESLAATAGLEEEEPAPTKGKAKAKAKSERGAVVEIDPDYFWVDPGNENKATMWMKLRREMGIALNLLVTGPSGCGKTELIKRLGREFGIPVYKIDCASITTPDKWVGHKELIATEHGQETVYVKSFFLRALAAEDMEPGIVLLDELNRLNAHLLNATIPVLDGSQSMWVPDLGIYSEVHKDTMIAATANLGVGYSGTNALDIALQDRFGVGLEATFPPKDEEIKVLMRRTGLDEARARILVNIASDERQKADRGELQKYISTRGLIDCAYFVAAGMKIVDAAQTTFVLKFSAEGRGESDRAAVELLVKGMAGNN